MKSVKVPPVSTPMMSIAALLALTVGCAEQGATPADSKRCSEREEGGSGTPVCGGLFFYSGRRFVIRDTAIQYARLRIPALDILLTRHTDFFRPEGQSFGPFSCTTGSARAVS